MFYNIKISIRFQ